MKTIKIGRNPNNDVVIQDCKVSNHHCQFVMNEFGKIIVTDLNSTNGTFVNGVKIIGNTVFKEGGFVRIGDTELNYKQIVGYFTNKFSQEFHRLFDEKRSIATEYQECSSTMIDIMNRYVNDCLSLEKKQSFEFYSDEYVSLSLSLYMQSVAALRRMLAELSDKTVSFQNKKNDDVASLERTRMYLMFKMNSDMNIDKVVEVDEKIREINMLYDKTKDEVMNKLETIWAEFDEKHPVMYQNRYEMAESNSPLWKSDIHNSGTPCKTLYLGKRVVEYPMFNTQWSIRINEYYTFINSNNVVVHYDEANRDKSLAFVTTMLCRLLMSSTTGDVVIDAIDADTMEGLCNNFKLLDRKLYRVSSRYDEVSRVLNETAIHVESIIQNMLTGTIHNLTEYNEGKENKESRGILVFNDFPAGLFSDTSFQIKHLMRNCVKAGVNMVIMINDSVAKCNEDARKTVSALDIDEKNSNYVIFDFSNNHFPLNDYGMSNQRLELDLLSDEQILRIVNCVNKGYEVKKETALKLTDYLPPKECWWSSRSSSMIEIPFGISVNKQIEGLRITQESGQNSAVVIGIPGSGKSVFLHSVIINAAIKYSPSELQMYLLDFSGVEFNTYALHRLPHAKVIAPEAEREFGLSVLRELRVEGERRMELCRNNDVSNIVELKNKNPEIVMPRLLVIIDEFQKIFEIETDKISQEANSIIHTIIQEFRKFGINLILATQRLPSSGILPKDLIANRVVFKSSPNDFNNLISCEMSRKMPVLHTGECIYNDESGAAHANSKIKSFYLGKKDMDDILETISEFSTQKGFDKSNEEMIVFRSNDLPMLSRRRGLRLHNTPQENPIEVGVYLGQPIEISDIDVFVPFRRESANNLLIIGGDSEVAQRIALCSAFSTSTSHVEHMAKYCIFNFMRPSDSVFKEIEIFKKMPFSVDFINNNDNFIELLSDIKFLIEDSKNGGNSLPNVYLTFFAFQFGHLFDKDDRGSTSKASQLLDFILKQGPSAGVFTILQVDNIDNYKRLDTSLNYFNYRVALQMSSSDSTKVIGSEAASKLRVINRPSSKYRALFFDNNKNTMTKFKPYNIG